MAHTVQRLGVKIGVIITIKGAQGAGKGCIIQLLATIFGHASFHHVQDIQHILGNFNSDQEQTNLLTFIDEAIFAGNKQQTQKLKTKFQRQIPSGHNHRKPFKLYRGVQF